MGIFSRIMEKLRSRGSGPIGNAQAGQPPAIPPGQQQTQVPPRPRANGLARCRCSRTWTSTRC